MIYKNAKHLFRWQAAAICICSAIILSSCSDAIMSNEVSHPIAEFQTTDDRDNASIDTEETDSSVANALELQIPSLSQEEIVGDYDPKIMVRLTSMMECMNFDIDEEATKYVYDVEDEDGTTREVEWNIEGEEDPAIWSPPGMFGTYRINQYDRNGNLVVSIHKQLIDGAIETTSIYLYERTYWGDLKTVYSYIYNDYEWEYILRYRYIYK